MCANWCGLYRRILRSIQARLNTITGKWHFTSGDYNFKTKIIEGTLGTFTSSQLLRGDYICVKNKNKIQNKQKEINFFVFHTSVLLLNHANRIKLCPLKRMQEVMAIIQKHCISKQDKAVRDPPKSLSFYWLSSIVFHAFLFNIICSKFSVAFVVLASLWDTRSIIISLSIPCHNTGRLTVGVVILQSRSSGKEIILSPAQVTLLSQQWLIVFMCFNYQQEQAPKLVGRENCRASLQKTQFTHGESWAQGLNTWKFLQAENLAL